MRSEMRRSFPARVAACGFITVILFGNLWLVYALLGQPVPIWMRNGFAIGIGSSLTGGVLMMAYGIHLKIRDGNKQ